MPDPVTFWIKMLLTAIFVCAILPISFRKDLEQMMKTAFSTVYRYYYSYFYCKKKVRAICDARN